MKKSIITLCWSLLLVACYKDITLDKYHEESVPVLNCLANSDTTLMADISTTWPYTAQHRADDISNLDVEVIINGESKGLMNYCDGLYRSDVYPQPGDVVEVRTVINGKNLSAQGTMPKRTDIERVDIAFRKVKGDRSVMTTSPTGTIGDEYQANEYTYQITFKNDPTVRRYYFVRINTANYMQILGEINFSYDPVFQFMFEQINHGFTNRQIINHYGLPFTNEGISGDEYTLTIKETGASNMYSMEEFGGRDRIITLYSISEAYYNYIISLLANDEIITTQGELIAKGLVEPLGIYSNVNGGTGILGCVVPFSMPVTLPLSD